MDQGGRETASPGEGTERVRARPYEWLGELIILGYEGGPYWHELEDPFEIARGTTEAREAVFVLEEVSDLGIVVRRPIREEERLGPPIFMPWAAVQAISVLEPGDEAGEEQEE